MSLQIWIWIIVGLTFALYIGIAIWSKAGSTNEFYIAGKGVNPIANGMATAADWMSAASFISMAGIISFIGYDGSVYLMGWTGGYVLLALLLAPYLRKFGILLKCSENCCCFLCFNCFLHLHCWSNEGSWYCILKIP